MQKPFSSLLATTGKEGLLAKIYDRYCDKQGFPNNLDPWKQRTAIESFEIYDEDLTNEYVGWLTRFINLLYAVHPIEERA